MAEPARPSAGPGGLLSGSWKGIPKPLLLVGGAGGAFLLYRWWRNRQSSSTAATAAPADTGTGSYLPYDSSGGGGSSGSGGGFPWLPAGQTLQPGSDTSTPATPTSGSTSSTDPSANGGFTFTPTQAAAAQSIGTLYGATSGQTATNAYGQSVIDYSGGPSGAFEVQQKALPVNAPYSVSKGPYGPVISVGSGGMGH